MRYSRRMSMKRSRSVSSNRGRGGSGRDDEFSRGRAKPARTYAWETDVAPQPDDAFVAYSPSCAFPQDALILHAKFGKGVITDVQGTKVDVLFEDGEKKLVHNPSGSAPAKAVIPPG